MPWWCERWRVSTGPIVDRQTKVNCPQFNLQLSLHLSAGAQLGIVGMGLGHAGQISSNHGSRYDILCQLSLKRLRQEGAFQHLNFLRFLAIQVGCGQHVTISDKCGVRNTRLTQHKRYDRNDGKCPEYKVGNWLQDDLNAQLAIVSWSGWERTDRRPIVPIASLCRVHRVLHTMPRTLVWNSVLSPQVTASDLNH